LYFKVVHHADISWVWVFGPFWIPMAIVIGISALALAIFLIVLLIAFLIDVGNGRV
jgi:hypothetical protein